MSQGWQYVITWVKKRFLQLTPFNPLYSQIFRENFAKNFPEPDCTEHTLDIVNLRNRDDPEHNWTFALFSVILLVWRKRLAKDNPRCIYLSWNFWHRKKKHTQNAIFVFLFNPKNYTTTVFFRNKYSTVVFMHHSQKNRSKNAKIPKFLPLSLWVIQKPTNTTKKFPLNFAWVYLHLHELTVIAELFWSMCSHGGAANGTGHLVGEQLAQSIYLSRVGPPNNA